MPSDGLKLAMEAVSCVRQLPPGCPKGQRSGVVPRANRFFILLKLPGRGIVSPDRAAVPGSHRRWLYRVRNSKRCTDELSSDVFRGKKASLLLVCRACAVLHCAVLHCELPVTNDDDRWYRPQWPIKMVSSKPDASQKQNGDPACFFAFGMHNQAKLMAPATKPTGLALTGPNSFASFLLTPSR